MIVHIKPDIVTKFGERINTGSMIKLGLNLVSKNVIIFSKISIWKRIIKRTISRPKRGPVTWSCDVTRLLRAAHFRITFKGHV